MNTVDDIVGYICKNFPRNEELSKGRITKLIFLSDWLMCLTAARQISPIVWYVNQYGPFTEDIDNLLAANPLFTLKETDNYYGGNKKFFFLKDANEFQDHLSEDDHKILLNVINKTQDLSWDKFRKIILNSYPLSNTENTNYQQINLVSLAENYRKELAQSKTQPESA